MSVKPSSLFLLFAFYEHDGAAQERFRPFTPRLVWDFALLNPTPFAQPSSSLSLFSAFNEHGGAAQI